MAPAKFELHALAKGADGSLRSFDLIILEPQPHEEFEWECGVVCEALRERPMKVFGDEPDFAYAMALGLVNRLIEYAEWTLVDKSGNTIALPKVPES